MLDSRTARTAAQRQTLTPGQIVLGLEGQQNPIRVSIQQFFGIEINDFAATVAKAALWIAENQMMQQTEDIVHQRLTFLPLKSYANIVEGNALRMDWQDVVPRERLNYVMGNPPFVGLSLRDEVQQDDMKLVFPENERAGRLDYVAAWYKKSAQYMQGSEVQAAFVSTNSIVQGEQVPILWGDLFDNHGVVINFAHRTFVWSSEVTQKASVHCVIIGFALVSKAPKIIFENDRPHYVDRINGYLVNASNVFINLRGKPRTDLPSLTQGNKPWDGGYLILSEQGRSELLDRYPNAGRLIRPYVGSFEFINNRKRYCLWLKDVPPEEYRGIPEIMRRLEGVAETRKKTKTVAVRALAQTPMLFAQTRQPESDYILVPETSSSNRKYIPIGFMPRNVIASNSTLVATDATLLLFGVLTSNVHMAWTRTVCGRLKSDYRYSPSVYNNFPWPDPSAQQKAKIEATGQAILDARALFPNSSLADLYDELTMPPQLRHAHQQNDRAVMEAYAFWGRLNTESECVAALMDMYVQLIEGEKG